MVKPKKITSLYISDIPLELHHKFQIHCVRVRKPQREVIIALLERLLKTEKVNA